MLFIYSTLEVNRGGSAYVHIYQGEGPSMTLTPCLPLGLMVGRDLVQTMLI